MRESPIVSRVTQAVFAANFIFIINEAVTVRLDFKSVQLF